MRTRGKGVRTLCCPNQRVLTPFLYFILGLTNAAEYEVVHGVPPTEAGDIDADGDLDFDDMPEFVDLLTPGLSRSLRSRTALTSGQRLDIMSRCV